MIFNKGPDKESKKGKTYCSFCGKEKNEVKKMIAGPNIFICDECVELCSDIVKEEKNPEETETNKKGLQILAPFKNEDLVYFSAQTNKPPDGEKEEIHLTFNRIACLAFSNIFTQLALKETEDEFTFDTKDLGYKNYGNGFKVTVCD